MISKRIDSKLNQLSDEDFAKLTTLERREYVIQEQLDNLIPWQKFIYVVQSISIALFVFGTIIYVTLNKN